MLIFDGLLTCYFGDRYDNFDYVIAKKSIAEMTSIAYLKKRLQAKNLIFLRQVHGNKGLIISESNALTINSFEQDGDFLITNSLNSGLGILTADCLPIILYDKKNNVAAVAHAGWRGSVQNIACNVVSDMHHHYGSCVRDITVFFGPSAKACCYTVSPDFRNCITDFSEVIEERNNSLFFDLPYFNQRQLMLAGIKKEAFCFDYNYCTICDERFFSFRRQGKQAGRQMTVVLLAE